MAMHTWLRSSALPVVIVAFALTCAHTAGADRSESFIGYSEKDHECDDTLPSCLERARQNGCAYDAFHLRRFCPATCTIERCVSRNTHQQHKHKGHATNQGTTDYAQMAKGLFMLTDYHFSEVELTAGPPVMLSRLGMGTYLGDTETKTDATVTNAILVSLTHGWNVLDTASNYRWGRAELCVGIALSALLAGQTSRDFAPQTDSLGTLAKNRMIIAVSGMDESQLTGDMAGTALVNVRQGGDVTRDMLFISTKAGFTTQYLLHKLIQDGTVPSNAVVDDMHTIHPEYLKASLDLSLERMRLETVDLLYLHNAAEVQLPAVGRDVFMQRLVAAFTSLEDMRTEGKIQYYGLATWDCFRRPPEDPAYLSLSDVFELAVRLRGPDHGFRFIQLPINVAMPEAWLEPWQVVQGSSLTLLAAAKLLGVHVMASGPLGEAELLTSMGPHLSQSPELAPFSDMSTKLLQYARSVPDVLTTLVGHKSQMHVEANLKLTTYAPLSKEEFKAVHKTVAQSRLRAKQVNQVNLGASAQGVPPPSS